MSASQEPLAKHVAPKISRARLEKQWAAIEPRLPSPARRRVAWPLGVALAGAVAVAALFFVLRRPVPVAATLVDGTWLESPASGPAPAVTLADGSRVSLGARSRLRLTRTKADDVRIDLERGRVDVQATHRDGRSFVVGARDVQVKVVGTRFSVEADGPVRVHVEEGRVRVDDAAGARDVSAGEEWTAEAPPPSTSNEAPAEPEETELDDDAADSGAPGRGAHRPRVHGQSAKELLDDAQRALVEGRTGDAARLFDSIRREHARDPRAALAAFELGRLRLDTLKDAPGAERAFRDAMRLARDASLRDDAEARRVEALDRMGAHDACVRARDAYLASHPAGVHKSEVSTRCGGT